MNPKEIAEEILEAIKVPSKYTALYYEQQKLFALARAYLELEKEYEQQINYIEKVLIPTNKITIHRVLDDKSQYFENRLFIANDEITKMKEENEKLKKSHEVLRKACEFYASSDQWNCTKEQLTTYNTIDKDDLGIGDFQFTCDVDDDRVGGKKAREALKADSEIMEGK